VKILPATKLLRIVLLVLLVASVQPVMAGSTAQDSEQEAEQLNQQAVQLYQHGKYQEALPLLQRTLEINEKVLGSGHERTATCLNNLGALYKALGQQDKALPLYQRALAIREKVLGFGHEDTANSLNNLGMLYLTLGQYDKALPLLLRSLEIDEKILGPGDVDTASSLNNLGLLHQALGQYDKALPLAQRALDIYEKTLGPEHELTATSLNNLGGLYRDLGQYDKALPLLLRSLEIDEKILGYEHVNTATSLNMLAILYQSQGQYDKALPLAQSALAIYEKVLGSEHPGAAGGMNNLGFLYQSLGQYDKALPLYQRALEIHEKVIGFEHENTARGLGNLAKLYQVLGQNDKALPLYQQSYRSASIARVPETLKIVQANLGAYYAEQGEPAVAILYLKGAVNTMQGIRVQSRNLDQGLQQSLLQKNESVYNRLIDLLVEEGRLAEAQQVISMLKEDEYFDFIRRDGQADNRSTRMNYNDRERPFAKALEHLGNEGAVLLEQRRALDKQAKLGLTAEQEQQRKKLRAKLVLQERQIAKLLNDIPKKLRVTGKGQGIATADENLDQLRATLKSLGHGAVLLSYIVADNHVRILLTTPNTLLARKAEISAKELNRKVTQFRRVLQNPALDPKPLAQEMYSLLISPVADDLKKANAKTLMLSLDGSLRYLPMGALHDGSAYLVERYPLSMFTEVAKDRLNARLNAHWKVAGLGLTQSVGEFSALPSVKQELTGIVKGQWWEGAEGVLPGDIYLDQDFTRSRLHGVLDRDYSVVHISSHFKFIPGNEAQSFLVLGDGQQLSLADIRTGGWQFNAVDLLTLSACETGLGGGKDGNGREIEGFGVLAQRQGAKGVMATLWAVADQSTAKFMREFYRFRQDGHLTKADALRKSQLAFINGSRKKSGSSADPESPYAHPYYWAPFILMGNWL